MLLEEQEVDVGALRPGMFVSRLDRDWIGTPFLLQGFLIENAEQIDQLASLCRSVYVDMQKSHPAARGQLQMLRPKHAAPRSIEAPAAAQSAAYTLPDLREIARVQPPPVAVAIEEELPKARLAIEEANALVEAMLGALREGGRLRADQIQAAVTPLVDSLLRNPDAYFWLETLRRHDSYSYSHAINCCALMAAFGRHLGFPDAAVQDMASGGLLLDIGKTAIPESLLDRDGPLTPTELQTVHGHVEHSVRLYDESGAGNAAVRELIRSHHEREDGSGYPTGRRGDLQPLLGRIAGIVDTFDALTTQRPYRTPISKHDALQWIYRERGKLFNADLVEQFVQCLGVYPTGTIVELSSGEVAIVLAQNPTRRLFPQVMLLTAPDKGPRAAGFAKVDLRDGALDGQGRPVTVLRSVEPGSYGLDPKQLYL